MSAADFLYPAAFVLLLIWWLSKVASGLGDQARENSMKIEKTTRPVIERQLLNSLEDKSKVAILATVEDLDVLIYALGALEAFRASAVERPHSIITERVEELRDGLQRLRAEAFK